jgi:hypothetical protein
MQADSQLALKRLKRCQLLPDAAPCAPRVERAFVLKIKVFQRSEMTFDKSEQRFSFKGALLRYLQVRVPSVLEIVFCGAGRKTLIAFQ